MIIYSKKDLKDEHQKQALAFLDSNIKKNGNKTEIPVLYVKQKS